MPVFLRNAQDPSRSKKSRPGGAPKSGNLSRGPEQTVRTSIGIPNNKPSHPFIALSALGLAGRFSCSFARRSAGSRPRFATFHSFVPRLSFYAHQDSNHKPITKFCDWARGCSICLSNQSQSYHKPIQSQINSAITHQPTLPRTLHNGTHPPDNQPTTTARPTQ